ncbi:PP2C family protein-serine/threonine phosphatase [Streptomyces huiliensis]|uniref:PP2C family protein-serine/threonine phosphatase n=1 Tax=Streptomyces huiliensis TaxID=2876027 RepID=UPI001CBA8D7B|nr:SpoIIE family protein phosphatase [Streptomyces huiliensis]MBZ4324028.1 SpoIIE family protein phosphatase [Streptomyces huiliensis]
MPSPSSASPAEHPAGSAPGGPSVVPGTVDALISQTRRLRGGIDAVRRETAGEELSDDPLGRWRRALCDLAAHQLDDLGAHLGRLRDGLPGSEEPGAHGTAERAALSPAPAGSAEWNLLTDEVTWSDELFRILGRRPEDGALTLDEFPSLLVEEDRELLTALVTDCLVDGKPIDGEFRVVHPDGSPRTLHMMGEPVLDDDGCTAAMWAVLRDVTTLRRGRDAVAATGDSLRAHRRRAVVERRLAAELQEAVLPPWYAPLRAAPGGALDVAARYLPATHATAVGGDWFDALPLPDGRTLLSAGGLTGRGVAAASAMAVLLGAVRGMAVAGTEPGPLLGCLNHLAGVSDRPALGSAVCCRYDAATRTLLWARAGHPAPLLFREGRTHPLRTPAGVLLGAVAGAGYAQAEERLLPGDVLVLHTGGLSADPGTDLLPGLAARFTAARSAQECVRTVLEEWSGTVREDDACVLVARVGS